MTDEPFRLDDEPQPTKKTESVEPKKETQQVLFSGLDLLPGQRDLFTTDGYGDTDQS